MGAGVGLLGGTAAGASAGQSAAWTLQRRYDIAYRQRMYAHGNQVPGFPVISAPPPPPLVTDLEVNQGKGHLGAAILVTDTGGI